MPFDAKIALPSPTGAVLALRVAECAGLPRGIVQINHGLAEHAGRYAHFAAYLAERGFHVYAHDHRGHGATKAEDAALGHFGTGDTAESVLADVSAVHAEIARRHAGLPVILFGHSMGGLIALNYLFRREAKVAGAAIWNANFSAGTAGAAARAVLAWERFRLGNDVPSRILPRLTFSAWARSVPERRSEFDWLSRDRSEVERYVADPLCGFAPSVATWQAVFAFIRAGADDGNLKRIRRDMPFHLVGGGHDPATDNGKAVSALSKRLERLGFSNLKTRLYEENRHESLNELNRHVIMEEFAHWAIRTDG